MENPHKDLNEKENQSFESDYQKIMSCSENSVIVKTEWSKKGDFFQKLSMYDDSYTPIQTFGNTTLIRSL